MNSLTKIMVKSFICLALFVSGGCCARQEQFKYRIVRKEYEAFAVTARLDGTYYKDRRGDVGNPYTLFVSLHPSTAGSFSINNLSLYSEGEKPAFEVAAPGMKIETGVDSKKFYFLKIPDLDIAYKEYRIKFEIIQDGELFKEVELLFEKDISKRLTFPWLETINSA